MLLLVRSVRGCPEASWRLDNAPMRVGGSTEGGMFEDEVVKPR